MSNNVNFLLIVNGLNLLLVLGRIFNDVFFWVIVIRWWRKYFYLEGKFVY